MSEWKTRRSLEFKHLQKMNGEKYITENIGLKLSDQEGRLHEAYRVVDEENKEQYFGTLENCNNWIRNKIADYD